jgi:hypothetical protein
MTNGIVSITVGGKMAMKVVAGIEGVRAHRVADLVRALGDVPSLQEMAKICEFVGFGSKECLVIQTLTGCRYEGNGGVFGLPASYRSKFEDPRYNPRFEDRMPWDTEHTVIVEFPSTISEESAVPGALTPSGERWHELQALAARFATEQYYREHPEHKPENHDCNNTDVVVGIPGLMKLIEEDTPEDNSYAWAFVRGLGWRLAYYQSAHVRSWEICAVNSRQEGGGRRPSMDIVAFVPLKQPYMPDWNLCKSIRELREETKILLPIIDEVKTVFPDASEEYFTSSYDWEIYATSDHWNSHVLGSHESRVAAWGKALKFARSNSGKRVAEKMAAQLSKTQAQV